MDYSRNSSSTHLEVLPSATAPRTGFRSSCWCCRNGSAGSKGIARGVGGLVGWRRIHPLRGSHGANHGIPRCSKCMVYLPTFTSLNYIFIPTFAVLKYPNGGNIIFIYIYIYHTFSLWDGTDTAHFLEVQYTPTKRWRNEMKVVKFDQLRQ